MKEGCPLSLTLFLYYDILLRETLSRHPQAHLYVFVDDIAEHAMDQTALLNTLNHLRDVAHRMGPCFNADKARTYYWARRYEPRTIVWQG